MSSFAGLYLCDLTEIRLKEKSLQGHGETTHHDSYEMLRSLKRAKINWSFTVHDEFKWSLFSNKYLTNQ